MRSALFLVSEDHQYADDSVDWLAIARGDGKCLKNWS